MLVASLLSACSGPIARPSLSASTDVFSEERWTELEESIRARFGADALTPGFRKPAYLPLDLDLLERVSFVGLPVADLDEVLRTVPPPYMPDQPWGSASWKMWPFPDRCHIASLRLEWEPDDDFVARVVREIVNVRSVCRHEY